MPDILIVEDERNLAEGLKFNLELEGHAVDLLDNAEDAFEVFANYRMLILDVMLPGMNGFELLRKIRQTHFKYPVLLLTAKSSEEDLLEGLQAGADDYITKPFSLPELILRVRRMLEREDWYTQSAQEESLFYFSDYWIDFDSFKARTNKGEVRLTPHECYVMKYLIGNRGRTVAREELLEKVWGYSVTPETRTVDIFIVRLRKLFEPDSKKPRHIKSVRGVGYQFFQDGE